MFNFGQSSSSSGNNFNFNSNPQQQQQQQQQPNSMFSFGGGASNATASNMFAPSSSFQFNPQTTQSQQQLGTGTGLPYMSAPPQTSTGIIYPRETNFMDLPVELRQNIEALERTIQSHADASRPFSNRIDPSDQICKIEDKLSLLEEKIAAYSCLHAQQNSRISSLKKATSLHWKYSENVARTIEASRSKDDSLVASSTGGKTTWSRAFAPNDPTASHFEDILKEMEIQMNEAEGMCEALKKQIEPFFISNSNSNINVTTTTTNPSPTESVKFLLKTEQEISASLQRRYNQIREELDLMKRNYRNFCSKYRRDARDPFAPKVIENSTKEREREIQAEYFGVSNTVSNQQRFPATYTQNVQNPSYQLGGNSSINFPSATTSLPTKSGVFSFGKL